MIILRRKINQYNKMLVKLSKKKKGHMQIKSELRLRKLLIALEKFKSL